MYAYEDVDKGRPKPGIGIGTVQVAFNRCPEVTSMTVTPLVTGIGGLVTMTATAEDPEGDEVSLAWSVSEGEILAGDDEFLTYECETIGFPTVTLEASDESGCTRATTIVLGCVAAP